MKRSSPQEIAAILKEKDGILVAGHVNPDGDTLGCTCALGLALSSLGKINLLYNPDDVPDMYKFLPGTDRIVRELPAGAKFDVLIAVDCENAERLGPLAERVGEFPLVIDIDHHLGEERLKGMHLLDRKAASTGEIVADVIKELPGGLTPEIAECLMTAIITDTGSFRFSSVRPSTLRTAADLLEAGASTSRIHRQVYENRSLGGVKILGAALSNIKTAGNKKIAYSFITREQISESKAADSETEGIVNYMRSVRGVKVGVLFTEGSEGKTKVSLRSRTGSDISEVARAFGGGGHKAAAGCTVDKPLDESIKLVIEAVEKWMESST